MTYPEALDHLLSLQRRGIKLDLDRMRACLEDLGRPQDSFRSILVAGTNGKGSTASALASILSRRDRRVGLFTSPHLHDYRERIRLDGKMVDGVLLAARVEADREVWERHQLTFFEATTALGFSLLRQLEVELAVLEIGLGGRLDATNVVDPVLSVIGPIGRDHVHVLGDSLPAIAGEKAGILRPGVPAVVAGGYAAAISEIARRARHLGSPLFLRPRCLHVGEIAQGGGAIRFRLHARAEAPGGFRLPGAGLALSIRMRGIHQVANAALAVLAAAVLRGSAEDPGDAEIAAGLARWSWPGRLERPRPDLPLLVDAAHNRESARALAAAVRALVPDREIRLVAGLVTQKDHAGFFRQLARVSDRAWIAAPGTTRAAPPGELVAAARAAGFRTVQCATVAEALDEALDGASDPDGPLVLLTGSLFTLDDGYRHLGIPPVEALWPEERP